LHAIIPAAGLASRLGRHAGGAPKALLPVAGRPILCHALDALIAGGVSRLTLVLGFQSQRLRDTLGERIGTLAIDYAYNADYASTEHGFSLYCARSAWERSGLPVLFMDADNVFEPALLARLLAAPQPDRVLVDPGMDSTVHDEELVLGQAGRVTGFVRGRARDFADCVGGFVGMNRFSPAYMRRLFAFMETLFAREGRGFKYERVFHRMLIEQDIAPAYLDTGTLGWVNVNHPHDVARAEALLARVAATHPQPVQPPHPHS
jgi:choline kinase